jgi:Tol biopolymer transport system component
MIARMTVRVPAVFLFAAAVAVACSSQTDPGASQLAHTPGQPSPVGQGKPPATPPNEARHLQNIKQLTSGGENAEAYFSADGTRLIFQRTTAEYPCDQQFTMNLDGSDMKLVSNGKGRTTCGYFNPDGKSIVYASTFLGGAECPPVPGKEEGYVWPIYDSYDIFKADVDGGNLTRITRTVGYDAEATVAKDGRIVFTSVRDGDMDIYSMAADGTDVKRLTNLPGPDGGAFFSADGSMIVFRGRHFEPGAELDGYMGLLKKALWRPSGLNVFVMNRDGSNLRQVTKHPGANWAPFFSPDGKKIIFASNMNDPKGPNFDLFLINVDGTGLEQITTNTSFDGFPMFSPDGKKLVFASNRLAKNPNETNVFIADWVW